MFRAEDRTQKANSGTCGIQGGDVHIRMLVCRGAASAEGESIRIHRIPLEEKRERRETRESCADSPEAEYHHCFLTGLLVNVMLFMTRGPSHSFKMPELGTGIHTQSLYSTARALEPHCFTGLAKAGTLDGFRLTQIKRKGEKNGIIHCPFPSLTSKPKQSDA